MRTLWSVRVSLYLVITFLLIARAQGEVVSLVPCCQASNGSPQESRWQVRTDGSPEESSYTLSIRQRARRTFETPLAHTHTHRVTRNETPGR